MTMLMIVAVQDIFYVDDALPSANNETGISPSSLSEMRRADAQTTGLKHLAILSYGD